MELNKDTMKKIMFLIVFTILTAVLCFHFRIVINGIRFILRILMPFIIGGVLAFILNLPMNFYEREFFSKGKRKKIIEQVTNYVFNVLGMEQLFISTKPEDLNIIKTLEELDFISLGEESGNIIYLKDKEEEKEIGRRL